MKPEPPIANHPQYDPKALRIKLTQEQIDSLPIREVTHDELYDFMCEWEYNPIGYYTDISYPAGVVGGNTKELFRLIPSKETG